MSAPLPPLADPQVPAPGGPDEALELQLPAPHGPWHRRLEVAAVTVTLGLSLYQGARIAIAAGTLAELDGWVWAWLGASVLAGVLAADFASGLIHWTFDRYGSAHTPFLGPSFISPFRIHHVDPEDITRHGFVETNGNTSLLAAPVLAVAVLLPIETPGALFTHAAVLMTGLFVVGTNQIHKWSHQEHPAALVALLQRLGLLLGRAHHQVHHTFPYEKNYCITTGWLNPPLMAIDFWARMERTLARLGAVAHRDAAPVERPGLLLRGFRGSSPAPR